MNQNDVDIHLQQSTDMQLDAVDHQASIDDLILKEEKQNDSFELLIFSEAGKPIYSYTKREDAVTLMPLCSALINYAKKAQKETLQSIRTSDDLVIHFATRSPLIIIVIHKVHSYVDHMMLVDQVEAQVISILTAKTLNSLFEDRPTFDLKRLLYGSEKLIDATTNLCAFPKKLHSPWIEAFIAVDPSNRTSDDFGKNQNTNSASLTRPYRILVPIVIIPQNTRDSIHSILQNVITNSSKNMVFSLLFRVDSNKKLASANEEASLDQDLSTTTTTTVMSAIDSSNNSVNITEAESNLDGNVGFKLITVCNHHERHKLNPADLHIILALLSGSRSQLDSVESLWMPICLPKFNRDAFVHSYIANINDNKHCIVLMSIDRDEFSICQLAKKKIEERLESLMKDSNHKNKYFYCPSPLVDSELLDLQDRLVNLRLCQPGPSEAKTDIQQQIQSFKTKSELYHARQLQFLWYQTGKHVLWWQRSMQKSISPVIYYMTRKMLEASLKQLWLKLANDTTLLGLHAPTFQLYVQFDCTISTNEATEVIQRITNWVKKEEDNFSIKDYR